MESDDRFAMVFRVGPQPGVMLRVVRVATRVPVPYTVFGWEVDEMDRTVEELARRGVAFLHYQGLTQDARGVWESPGGTRVAWFQDPDGNVLSLSQHTAPV